MKVELIETSPRVYRALLDFNGYKYTKNFDIDKYGNIENSIHVSRLDTILAELKLRRINYWHTESVYRGPRYKNMIFIYTTSVISDRE